MHEPQTPAFISPLRASLLYMLVASIWVLASDSLLSRLIHDPRLYYRVQTINILLFVAFTATILYALLRSRRQNLQLLQHAFDELVVGASLRVQDDYLKSLALHLVRVTGHDYVLIGEYLPQEDRIHNLIAHGEGFKIDNDTYALEGTPCEKTLAQGLYACSRGLRQRFPSTAILQQLKVESYIGHALVSSEGEMMGLIALMGKTPLKKQRLAEGLLRILASKATHELERRASAQQQQTSDARFSAVIEEASDAILGLDADLNIQFMNSAAETLFARSEGETLGHPFSQLLSQRDQSHTLKHLRELLALSGYPTSARMEMTGLRPDGATFSAEVGASVTPPGSQRRCTLIIRDVSARKAEENRLMAQFDQASRLFDSLKAVILVTDFETNEVLFINQHGRDLFQKQENGRKKLNIPPCVLLTKTQLIHEGNPTPSIEHECQDPNSRSWYRCLDKAIPWNDDAWVRLSILSDISNHKTSERIKGGLLSKAAHDLRTPLTAIMGYSDLLLMRENVNETQQRYLGLIRDESEKIDRLLDAFSKLSKLPLQISRLQHSPVSLTSILRHCAQLNSLQNAHTLQLSMPDHLPNVLGQSDQLQELMSRLTLLAFRLTPKGGTLQIVAQAHTDEVLISLTATGPEIDRKLEHFLMNQINHSMDDADSLEERHPELEMIQWITQHHQGSIAVDAASSDVTLFRVTLPVVAS